MDKAYRDLYTFHVMPWRRVCTVGVDLVNGLSSARVPEYVDDDLVIGECTVWGLELAASCISYHGVL